MKGLKVAEKLLLRLTELRPPPKGRYHSLMLREDGTEGLSLVLQKDVRWQSINIDPEDFDKDMEDVVVEVLAIAEGDGHD